MSIYQTLNPGGKSGKLVFVQHAIPMDASEVFEIPVNDFLLWDKPDQCVKIKGGKINNNSTTIRYIRMLTGAANDIKTIFNGVVSKDGGPLEIPTMYGGPGEDITFKITDTATSQTLTGFIEWEIVSVASLPPGSSIIRTNKSKTFGPSATDRQKIIYIEEMFGTIGHSITTGQAKRLLLNPMVEICRDENLRRFLRLPRVGTNMIVQFTGTTYLNVLNLSRLYSKLNTLGAALVPQLPRIAVRTGTTEANLYAAAWTVIKPDFNADSVSSGGSANGKQLVSGLTAATSYFMELMVVFGGCASNQTAYHNSLHGPASKPDCGALEALNFFDIFGFAGDAALSFSTFTLTRAAKYVGLFGDSIYDGYLEAEAGTEEVSYVSIAGITGFAPSTPTTSQNWDREGFLRTYPYLAMWTYCNAQGTPTRPVFINHSAPGRTQAPVSDEWRRFQASRGYGNYYKDQRDTFIYRYQDYSEWTNAADETTLGAVTLSIAFFASFANTLFQALFEGNLMGVAAANRVQQGTPFKLSVGSTLNVGGVPESFIKRIRSLWAACKVVVVAPTFTEATIGGAYTTLGVTTYADLKVAIGIGGAVANFYAFDTGGADNSWGRFYDTPARTAQTGIPTDGSLTCIHPNRTMHAAWATDLAATITALAP